MSEMAPIIVVIGSANTDFVVSVPHIPAPGETIIGGNLAIIPGGKGANQAVAAARLGGQVPFIARVGADANGQAAIAGYRAEGIDTNFVFSTEGVPSGVALITVDSTTGQNAIVVSPGANASLSPADVDAAIDVFANAAIVVASLEVPLATVVRAAEVAASYGVPFILNPAPAQTLPEGLFALTTILTPNETEAAQILNLSVDTPPTELAVRLRSFGVKSVIVTTGKEGAVLSTEDGTEQLSGIPVVAVDTVAAGDCFTGALAVRVALGDSLRDAVLYANRAAALKVTRHGAQPGLPTKLEVDTFLQK